MGRRRIFWTGLVAVTLYASDWFLTIEFGLIPVSERIAEKVGVGDRSAKNKILTQVFAVHCPVPLLMKVEWTVQQQPYTLYQRTAWFIVTPLDAYEISEEEGWDRH
jgi:hypothetical protein